jgi:hypothetical protein
MRGLGFVYFKGSENVNLFAEAELRWMRSLKVRICLAEKISIGLTMAGFGWTAEPLERSERPTACGKAVLGRKS